MRGSGQCTRHRLQVIPAKSYATCVQLCLQAVSRQEADVLAISESMACRHTSIKLLQHRLKLTVLSSSTDIFDGHCSTTRGINHTPRRYLLNTDSSDEQQITRSVRDKGFLMDTVEYISDMALQYLCITYCGFHFCFAVLCQLNRFGAVFLLATHMCPTRKSW